jgi:hypothetical protein
MAEIHPKRVKIGGRYWTLTTANIPGYDGLVENDSRVVRKHIWINRKLKGKALLGAIIHELLHIIEPRWSEDVVLELEEDLTKILWDLGYRSTDLGDED